MEKLVNQEVVGLYLIIIIDIRGNLIPPIGGRL